MSKKLEWLEVMRGLAACWVVLHHADLSISHFYPGADARPAILMNGFLGVDFFFILSGFIIAYSSNKLIASGRKFKDYASLRLIRIYIPYLPIGILMYAVLVLLPNLSAADRSIGLWSSLLLLPSNYPPALSVAWTLIHEIIFYVVFSLIFWSKRLLGVVISLWCLAIIYVFFNSFKLDSLATYFLSPLNLNFILGVCIYYLTRKGIPNSIGMASALAGAILVLIGASSLNVNHWLVSIGFAGLILAAITETAQKISISSRVLIFGSASYSIYLIHNPAISVITRVFKEIPISININLLFSLISLMAISFGVFYYYFYEKNALSYFREKFLKNKLNIEIDKSLALSVKDEK